MEAVYFIVETRNGRISSSLCYDLLPTKYQGKKAKENGLVYYRRIDDQPHLCDRGRDELFNMWELLGELPSKEAINPLLSPEETERKRIAERVRNIRILRLTVGADPLDDINDIIQRLANDIENDWTSYDYLDGNDTVRPTTHSTQK